MWAIMLMKDLSDYCDRDKVREILNYAKTANQRDYLILKVLWESGMRVSELAALTPRDLEPQNHAIVIRNGKGNKSRRVYVDYKTEDHEDALQVCFSYESPRGNAYIQCENESN